jgi:PAS domain S-box-containing protein
MARALAKPCSCVCFDEPSTARLRSFSEKHRTKLESVCEELVESLAQDERANAWLAGGEPQAKRLTQTLARWLDTVLSCPDDPHRLHEHQSIGRMHAELGLPEELLVWTMSRIRTRLIEMAFDADDLPKDEIRKLVISLGEALDRELSVMLEGLHEELLTRDRKAERRELAEAVPAFVIALNGEGSIELWNTALERVTGFSREEMLGAPASDLIAADGDQKLPLKQGGYRLVRWQSSSPTAGSGLTYAVGVDVTEERAMMRRTVRAERLAAVGTLAAGLAHEVRNPLNSAILQLQVLRRRIERGAMSADVLPVADIIHDEMRRLDRLVTDFLAFAQRRPLETRPVHLNQLVRKVVSLIRSEAVLAKVSIEATLAEGVGRIELDEERMREVLLNLMRNGIEAMPSGGTLRVRTSAADANGEVRIDIEDTGSGLPEDAPIFDAFYTTKETGTGLGLAIVHRIVSDHGGSVHVQSRPGETRFTLALPQQEPTAGRR